MRDDQDQESSSSMSSEFDDTFRSTESGEALKDSAIFECQLLNTPTSVGIVQLEAAVDTALQLLPQSKVAPDTSIFPTVTVPPPLSATSPMTLTSQFPATSIHTSSSSENAKMKRKLDTRADEEQKTQPGGLYSFFKTVSKDEWHEIEREKAEKNQQLYLREMERTERREDAKKERVKEMSRIRSQKYRDRKKEDDTTKAVSCINILYFLNVNLR